MMLRSMIIIFFFLLLGTGVSWVLPISFPGSVLGMLLLTLALSLKIIKPESVKPAAKVLTSHMALFFVPSGVGLITCLDLIKAEYPAILFAVFVSTTIVLVVTGGLAQQMEKKQNKKLEVKNETSTK